MMGGKDAERVSVAVLSDSPLEERAYLEAIVKSIEATPCQLMLVTSQALSEATESYLRSLPLTKIISHPSLKSRAGLRNLAIQASQSEYIVFLDGRTMPQEEWLERLLLAAEEHPEVCAVGSVCVHPGNRKILHAGIDLSSDAHPLYCLREDFFQQLRAEDFPLRPLAVSGSCLLLRRDALEKTGYFNEAYRDEYEDIDLCLRIQAAGFQVALCPASVVFQEGRAGSERLQNRRENLSLLKDRIERDEAVAKVFRERVGKMASVSGDEKTPLVSVLYPAYNDELFLEENIESVINQTYRDWELIILDDASTDSTAEILERYRRAYPEQIKITRKSNHDRGEAWYMLYDSSRGKYLNILGADDIILPDKLMEQVRIMEEQPHCAFVYTDVYQFDEEGRLMDYVAASDYAPEYQLIRLMTSNYVFTPSVLMRKSHVEESGGWLSLKHWFSSDYDLWLRLLKGRTVRCVHKPLLKYRRHSAQLSELTGNQKLVNNCEVIIEEKFNQWRPEDLFPQLDLNSEQDLAKVYSELAVFLFSPYLIRPDLQLKSLDFFRVILDKRAVGKEAKQAKGYLLFRLSHRFYRQRQYRLAIKYLLKSLPFIPFFAGKLLTFSRKKFSGIFSGLFHKRYSMSQ
jgi:GT2 family glycosyltransferase